MDKPKQTERFFENPDNSDLLEELEEAMGSIAIAMEHLRGYEEFSDWFDTLDDVFDEMKPMYEECEAIAAEEYAEEMEGLRRQYYRDVL